MDYQVYAWRHPTPKEPRLPSRVGISAMRFTRTVRRAAVTAISVAAAGALVVGTGTAASAAPKPRAATPTLSSDQTGTTRSASVTLTFSSTTTGAKYTCVLDGTSSTCTSPKSYSGLADGTHNFSVTASAKNLRPSLAATKSWTVDRVNPSAVVFAGVPATPVKTSPNVTFTGESGATYTCQIDTHPESACTQTSTGTSGVTGEGRHTVTVVVT